MGAGLELPAIGAVVFDPWLGAGAVLAVLLLAAAVAAVAAWQRLAGWLLRGLGLALVAAALANPALERGAARPLDDIVILLDDRSASQTLSGRAEQTEAAVAALEAALDARPGTELRRVSIGDDDEGSLVGGALTRAIAAEPEARVAGIIAVTDGLAHDGAAVPADAPAPVHVLLTGAPGDWDRRLVVEEAPGYGLIGDEVLLQLRLAEDGRVPPELAGRPATLRVAQDGVEVAAVAISPGAPVTVPVTLRDAGPNSFALSVETLDGELTALNDTAAVTVTGIRDRLRVLLVSGEPNPGERTWRNLLKSDAGVDLIHFTILRPPEKFDGVPVDELALIAFPTDALFLERIDDFDLIIFDRYRVRGILLPEYYENIRRYVENGGAVLVSSGPEYATVESLSRSALGRILPAEATGRVIEAPFRPQLTRDGRRHPVTAALPGAPAADGTATPRDWGRWLRLVETRPRPGTVVAMEDGEGRPLLMLDRVGDGRVALIASDQVWLWGRGFEGGGPQQELLRRIAHWSMKEPELEEETLRLSQAPGLRLEITRHSLADAVEPAVIETPSGEVETLPLEPSAEGRFRATWSARDPGLHIVRQGELSRSIVLGPAAPREFSRTVADATLFGGLVEASGGSIGRLSDGVPGLRDVAPGRSAAGQGVGGRWIGLTPRGAETVIGLSRTPLLPGWAWLALAALTLIGGWLIESRRRS